MSKETESLNTFMTAVYQLVNDPSHIPNMYAVWRKAFLFHNCHDGGASLPITIDSFEVTK